MGRHPSQLRRLAPCTVLAIAAHAAVLALPAKPAARARDGAEQIHALHVRVVPAPVAAASASPASGWIEAAREAVSDTGPVAPIARIAASKPVPPTATPPKNVRPDIEARGEGTTRPASHVTQAHAGEAATDEDAFVRGSPDGADMVIETAGWALSRAATGDDAFVARALLSVAPQPLEPVIVPVPDFVLAGEVHRGELTLFIDETGAVVRVRAETDTLPDALQDVARDAFMAVRFAPGELTDAGAVKSRIRIEVVFDGGPRPAPPMPLL